MIYDRKIRQKINNVLKSSHEIIILLGTRQTGKTTLTKLIAQNADFEEQNKFYFDMEDKSYRTLFNLGDGGVALLQNIFTIQNIDTKEGNLLIFDEIQLLDDPSNLLKVIHDNFKNLRIIATGSSTLQIKTKFSDSLAGRRRIFQIEPLSFDEFLLFKNEKTLLNIKKLFKESEDKNTLKAIIEAHRVHFMKLFEEYITYGGYPEVVLMNSQEEKIEKLVSISDAYIQKDIREFANIENIDAYNNLLKYLAINSGNLLNKSSLSVTLGIGIKTVDKYITLLKETFIIGILPPFYTNKNKEISKNNKIYFKDMGLRNLQMLNFNAPELRADKGILYENYVFNTLENNKKILVKNHFYRTQSKTEIDFIRIETNKYELIEVKSSVYKKNIRAFYGFQQKYKNQTNSIDKIIINKSHFEIREDVLFLPAYLL